MDTQNCYSPWPLPSNKKNSATRLISSITNIATTLVSTAESLISFIVTRTKKANRDSSNHGEEAFFLPIEILVEILRWLDAKSLLRFKSVCKQWHAMIEDPNFVEEHARLARPVMLYQDEEAQDTFKFHISYNGLILESKRGSGSQTKYRVRNPTMRRVYDIPDPHEKTMSMVISYAPSSGCYKLISVHEDYKIEIFGVEILTLGCVDQPSWRCLDATLLRVLFERYDHIYFELTKGVVHFCPDGWIGSKDFEVVSLNIDKECFTSTMLPSRFFPDSQTKVCPIRYADDHCYLSSAEIVKDELRLLVLEDYEKGKWTENKITIPLKFLKCAQPYAAFPWEVWFLMNGETKIYHIESQQMINKESPPPGKKEILFKLTLETFKGMRSEEN